jgi:hypothetical protein
MIDLQVETVKSLPHSVGCKPAPAKCHMSDEPQLTHGVRESLQQDILRLWIALLLFIGPSFGPIPRLLRGQFDTRAAAGWLVLLLFVQYAIMAGAAFVWMRRRGWTPADFGLKRSTSWGAILVGILVGVLWSFAGVGAMLEHDPNVNALEFSPFRLYMASLGAIGALLEDILVRGGLMNALHRQGSSGLRQALHSSLLFAVYHSIWNMLDPAMAVPALIASFIYGMILSGLYLWGGRSLVPVACGHSLALLLGEPFLTLALVLSV